jgi:hypothetical protein
MLRTIKKVTKGLKYGIILSFVHIINVLPSWQMSAVELEPRYPQFKLHNTSKFLKNPWVMHDIFQGRSKQSENLHTGFCLRYL